MTDKQAKFTQIAIAAAADESTRVYALDESGHVWLLALDFNGEPEGWERVTTKRLPVNR